jgi:aldehyde:ferredoxin oxidoreductase
VSGGNGQDRATADLMAVLDSVGLCPFLAAGISAKQIVELLRAATGIEFTQDEIVQAGQRIGRAFWQTA